MRALQLVDQIVYGSSNIQIPSRLNLQTYARRRGFMILFGHADTLLSAYA